MDPMIINSNDEVRRTKVNNHQVAIFLIIVLPQLFISVLGVLNFLGVDTMAIGMLFALTAGIIFFPLFPIVFTFYIIRTIRYWKILNKYNQQGFVLMMVAEAPILYSLLQRFDLVFNINIKIPEDPMSILAFLFFLWGTVISLTPYFITRNNYNLSK